MPRGPRLDAPGVLHHAMARGLECCALFRDDRGRSALVRRLAARADAHAWTISTWALLPNHVHRLGVPAGARWPRPGAPASPATRGALELLNESHQPGPAHA